MVPLPKGAVVRVRDEDSWEGEARRVVGPGVMCGRGCDFSVWTRCASRVTGAHGVLVKGLQVRGLGHVQSSRRPPAEDEIAPAPVSRPGFVHCLAAAATGAGRWTASEGYRRR